MTKILLIIAVAIVVGLAGYVLLRPATSNSTAEPVQTAPTDTEQDSSSASAALDALRRGGNSFADPKGVFGFLYPNDYTQDSQGNGQYIRIYKNGPSQQGQTEMYDGVIMVFESIDLEGLALTDWIDEMIENSTADGTSEVTQPKEKTMLNGYPGYTYSIRGLGESTYTVIQKNDTSDFAVSITMAVNDPTGAGFKQEVDAILSTVELRK